MDLGEPQVVAIAGESTSNMGVTSVQQQDTPQPTSMPASEQQQTQQQEPQAPGPPSSNSPSSGYGTTTGIPSPSASGAVVTLTGSTGLVTVTLAIDRTISPSASSPAPAATATQTITGEALHRGANSTIAISVGVGVGIGVLLFLTVFGACWYMQRKKRRQRGVMSGETGDEAVDPFERVDSRGTDAGKNDHPYGRGSGVLYELEGHRAIELPANGDPREMDGRGLDKEEKEIEMTARAL